VEAAASSAIMKGHQSTGPDHHTHTHTHTHTPILYLPQMTCFSCMV